jgi:hypothetical protein
MIEAPGGWGYPPGFAIGEVTIDDLPELPLLHLSAQPTRVVEAALRGVRGLCFRIQPGMLVKRYGLPQATASDLLTRLRKGCPR